MNARTDAQQDAPAPDTRPFWARNILVILAAVIAVLAIVIATIVMGVAGQDRDQALAEKVSVSEKLSAAQNKEADQQKQLTKDVSGADLDRKAADDKIITDLMKTATTWKTGAEYNAAREDVIRQYKIPADSEFMTTFLPEQKCSVDSTGKKYCPLDYAMKTTSSSGSISTSVIGIESGKYTYFARAQVLTPSVDGSVTLSRTVPLSYSIDGQGNITDLTAYATFEDPQTSS